MNIVACLLALSLAAEPAKNPFLFNNGDRVVFLGSTLIEREQKYGYWELALTLLNKDKNVTFRNLGWSGDTVWCESRGSFDGPKKGFENTIALVKELKPTVIVLCYGQVESFDGPDGVKKFTEGYEKLIDALAPTRARIVLMTPTCFENIYRSDGNPPVKNVEERNTILALYRDAMKTVATQRKTDFYDMFFYTNASEAAQKKFSGIPDRTENGLTMGEYGYATTRFDLYVYHIPGEELPKPGSDEARERAKQENDLRQAIVAKNRLYFDRWRPQNQTYLFGFRKKEQGQNAKEIAEFDPLIEKAEKDIAELRKKIK